LKPLKIGIAGFGKMGQIRADEIVKNSATKLVAVFEQYGEVPRNKYQNVIHCSSYVELLEQDLDAVFICAFNDVASIYTIKALQKNLHVFCEKPPAHTVKELQKVLDVEKQKNLVLKYGFFVFVVAKWAFVVVMVL